MFNLSKYNNLLFLEKIATQWVLIPWYSSTLITYIPSFSRSAVPATAGKLSLE